MKIRHPDPVRHDEGGMASMVFIVLLAIMMILVAAEGQAIYNLHRNVKFMEQQQIKRLDSMATNNIAISASAAK